MNKEKLKQLNILVTVGTYLSYCLAFSFTAWGVMSSYAGNPEFAIFFNKIFASLIGGLLPFAAFTFVLRMTARGLLRYPSFDMQKITFALKLYIIAANVVCFFTSFTYYAFRPFYVWGDILFNFIITAFFITAYLFYMVPRLVDKSKIALFIVRVGGAFLLTYLLIAIVNIIAGLL